MNNRFSFIRNHLNLTQDAFSQKIGLSRNYVWMIEKGERVPSDRTITDICRTFGVNEAWLRTGIGEPFIQLSREDEIASILGKVIAGHDSEKSAFIRALARIPDDAFPAITQLFLAVAEELQKEKPE
jgi:transcriptional regulator with XRE-family HTH domain